jgi:hypothetical protein
VAVVPGEPGDADRFSFLPESLRRVAKEIAGSESEPVSTGFEGAAAPGRSWTLPVLCYQTPARCDSRSSPAQFRLFQLKSSRPDGCAVDHDINAIRADSERARVQVIDVLATIDPEV